MINHSRKLRNRTRHASLLTTYHYYCYYFHSLSSVSLAILSWFIFHQRIYVCGIHSQCRSTTDKRIVGLVWVCLWIVWIACLTLYCLLGTLSDYVWVFTVAFLLRAVIYVEIIESTGMGNLSILFDRISWYECISCTWHMPVCVWVCVGRVYAMWLGQRVVRIIFDEYIYWVNWTIEPFPLYMYTISDVIRLIACFAPLYVRHPVQVQWK